MEIRFEDPALDRLEVDRSFTMNQPPAIVKAYRKRIWQIRAAHDVRDFYNNKGFHFEKRKTEPGVFEIRLNDQFRLFIRFEGESPRKIVVVIGIKDLH